MYLSLRSWGYSPYNMRMFPLVPRAPTRWESTRLEIFTSAGRVHEFIYRTSTGTGQERFIYLAALVDLGQLASSVIGRHLMASLTASASVEITVTISPGEDTPFPSITLQTDDTQGLRRLLDECKRLKEAVGRCSICALLHARPS